jgi:hypothetical protein
VRYLLNPPDLWVQITINLPTQWVNFNHWMGKFWPFNGASAIVGGEKLLKKTLQNM